MSTLVELTTIPVAGRSGLHPRERDRLIRRAKALSWLSLAWMTVEGTVAIAAALIAGSVALLGLGIDSAIEGLASVVVIWRFTGRRRLSERAELRAQKAVAISFFLFAPYIAQEAIRALVASEHPSTSWVGIGLSVSSIGAMPLLGRAKQRLGERLGSGATAGEGSQNLLCAYMAAGVLVGLGANAALGWWWLDPVVALAIAAIAVREGGEAWAGHGCACVALPTNRERGGGDPCALRETANQALWRPDASYGPTGSVLNATDRMLRRRGLALEYATLAWNVVGTFVLALAAVAAGSVALAGFGVDSLIEIVASAVVVWQLNGAVGAGREQRALRIIAIAFVLLAVYIAVQAAVTLSSSAHPGHSVLGIVWLALTVLVMFALAGGKRNTGERLGNMVLRTEARVTAIDGTLAVAVLAGVVLNAAAGWWWADPLSALVILVYGLRAARHAWAEAA